MSSEQCVEHVVAKEYIRIFIPKYGTGKKTTPKPQLEICYTH